MRDALYKSREMASPPKVKHRMKRPQPPGARPGRPERDIKKAFTTDQLAEIGAISFKYNQIESLIEFILLVVLEPPPRLWLHVVRRINGMENKLSILRRYYETNKILTDEAKLCLKNVLDGVSDYKKYRDIIIHSVPFDVDKGIGQHITTRADAQQILLTKEALSALYERLCILSEELIHADLLFRLGSETGAKAIYPYERDPSRVRRERDVPQVLALVQQHQSRRVSLPPLPEFPSEEAIQDAQAGALLDRLQTDLPRRQSNIAALESFSATPFNPPPPQKPEKK
jgi:hypothetical protein